MSIADRAKAALAKARKEGRRIEFLVRHVLEGEVFYQRITRKDYVEGDDAWVQTWVEGDFKNTSRKEQI